jgi:hypothetical protein
MLCPFHPSYGEFFDDLRELILTYTKQHNPVRMLDLRSPRLVGQALYEQIRWSTLCIVDWTHWRANVLFEFGVRLACSAQHPFCIYDEESTNVGLDDRDAFARLEQHELMMRLFGPTTYGRATARDDLRAIRDWRSATLDAPWQPPKAVLPPGATFGLSQSTFGWEDDPFLAMPHVEQQRTIERAVGSNRTRQPERPALFADAPAYDAALLDSAKERWIAAWLYLRHLHLDSGDEASNVAELLTVARRAQNALLGGETPPRHQRVLDEIKAFLDADRAARQRRRIEGGNGS